MTAREIAATMSIAIETTTIHMELSLASAGRRFWS